MVKGVLLQKLMIIGLSAIVAVAMAAHVKSAPKTIPILTLSHAIALAIRNNPDLKQNKLNRVAQKFALLVAEHEFKPHYTLAAGYRYGDDVTEGRSVITRHFYVTPSIGIKNHHGTTASVSFDNVLHYQRPGFSNFFSRSDYQGALTVKIEQNLLRGFSQTVVDAALNDARDAELSNKLTFQNSIVTALTTVINDYFGLIQTKQTLSVDSKALANYEHLVINNRLLVKAGRLAPADTVQAQAQVASQKVTIENDKNLVKSQQRRLLDDIGLRADMPFALPRDLTAELKQDERVLTGNRKLPDLSWSQQYAITNNAAYQQAILVIRQASRDLVVAKDNANWSLKLTASRTQGGQIMTTKLSDLATNDNTATTVALDLTIPIDNISNQQAIIDKKIAFENAMITLKEQRQRLYSAIEDDLNNVKSSYQQLLLAKHALTLQQKDVTIAKQLHAGGRISTFELITKQQNLSQAQTTVINSHINYLMALANFNAQINATLQRWHIKIRY